ncbi:endonuclease III [Desulfobacca acetoxidans]|uniref:Adenine DNA glycosylase n=1 Tax=Desulfobacca acetoxidans (strain ATCC 700848 / DSM 11109 / ASRB2) TaxID=880072 RepID=F2NEM5_DESAR|nr:endonuclease III [Desulfobacca acetoxidans]AEB08215.1 HhH-GPD family protein [Desulfobacca acetoxidans DSM 11109]
MATFEDTATIIASGFRKTGLTDELIAGFQGVVYQYYQEHGRVLPWRRTSDPYHILVSEIMLQQTQVERVLTKYELFLARFPNFEDLSRTSLREILKVWQGLGYNRRAKALQAIARQVVAEFDGRLPADRHLLQTLPGIGPATAGAVLAFAFEQPVIFLETNIRRVFLHFFYPAEDKTPDKMLLPLIILTLDSQRVRHWYYALMDYGAMLKKTVPNPNRRSAHYARQSPFRGSDREIRSQILQIFLARPELTESALLAQLQADQRRSLRIIQQLVKEGFLLRQEGRYRLTSR